MSRLRRSVTVPATLLPLLSIVGQVAVLVCLGSWVAFADVSAHLYMSTSPGGEEVPAIRSGAAKAYAVISYEDTAQTELKVVVISGAGIVLFEHSDIYDGSGESDVEISGRDIFVGYMSAAQTQSDELQEAEAMAHQASSASAKRVRASSVVNVATTLESVLAALERYPLSLEALDRLEEARDRVAEVEVQGTLIINEVSDDDLDAAMDQLETLVTDAVDAVGRAPEGLDTETERAWLDGAYTIQLKRNGEISVGFDWEVGPDGVPGTPVAPSPTAGAEPTETLPLTATRPPTATPSQRPSTATSGPTSVSAGSATPTTPPGATQPPPATAPSGPVILPPTAPAADVPATPASTPFPESQAGYPAPPAAGEAGVTATPAAQAMSQNDLTPETEAASEAAGLRPPGFAAETPLAPQEVREWPVARILALMGAVLFGLVALWLRARI